MILQIPTSVASKMICFIISEETKKREKEKNMAVIFKQMSENEMHFTRFLTNHTQGDAFIFNYSKLAVYDSWHKTENTTEKLVDILWFLTDRCIFKKLKEIKKKKKKKENTTFLPWGCKQKFWIHDQLFFLNISDYPLSKLCVAVNLWDLLFSFFSFFTSEDYKR